MTTSTASVPPGRATDTAAAEAATQAAATKEAHGWLHTARFLTTAPQLQFLPPLAVPEIAFVGRSNAGKSTCINTLTQQKQLAFASKKPGRTQHINLSAQAAPDSPMVGMGANGLPVIRGEARLRPRRRPGRDQQRHR